MAITDPLTFAPDLIFVPARDLDPELRAQIDCADDDCAVSKPHSRTRAMVIDRRTQRFLAHFHQPTTVAEAVIAFCIEAGADPEESLKEAYPLLQKLYNSGFLIDNLGSALEDAPRPGPGDELDTLRIVSLVQQLDDSDVYQARDQEGRMLALKVARASSERSRDLVAREVGVLGRLAGDPAPMLRKHRVDDSLAYLAMDWVVGVDAGVASGEVRQSQDALFLLCFRVLDAYSRLHEKGVLHGDVHPRNVLVARDGSVTLIDFGLAHLDSTPAPSRGGVEFFFEPELAIARNLRARRPAVSARGEQYSVAALVYFLVAGVHYLDFSLEKDLLYRQIQDLLPIPFAARGVDVPAAIEAVLFRALAKDPLARFEDLRAFADAWRDAAAGAAPPRIPRPGELKALPALKARVRERLGVLDGAPPALPTAGPTSSLNYGHAGVAYALYRMAQLEEDQRLLAIADIWSVAAIRASTGDRAFHDASFGITVEEVGRGSLFHGPAGIHCVQALVSHALGDSASVERSLIAFFDGTHIPCRNDDVAVGRAGHLFGCAALLEALDDLPLCRAPILRRGNEIVSGILTNLERLAEIAAGAAEMPFLGFAHGWAGLLTAVLRWSEASGQPLDSSIEMRLTELSSLSELSGRGARWPRKVRSSTRHGTGNYLGGWCNGVAGFVPLYTLAAKVLRKDKYLVLAEQAAWATWENGEDIRNLCCGLVGRAYALLNVYRASGDDDWLDRARRLGDRAASRTTLTGTAALSLFKGDLGTGLLAFDLEHPERSCFPMLEREGWTTADGRGAASPAGHP